MIQKKHSFTLCNIDTDAISICKQDGSFISEDERESLLEELNSLYHSEIKFTDDGYFPRYIILKAKNYIMYDGKKIKLKGSSLKSSTLEPRLKEFLKECIDLIVFNKIDEIPAVYTSYIKEISKIEDITPWAKKMTLSEKTYASVRENEQKLLRAVAGKEYKEGDKVYVYPKESGELGLASEFSGDHNKVKFYEKLFKTVKRFETIIDVKMCLNYSLKKNQKALQELLLSL